MSRVQSRPRKRRNSPNSPDKEHEPHEPHPQAESPSILDSPESPPSMFVAPAPVRNVDNDSCIVIESDDEVEITSQSSNLDDSVICLGPATSLSPSFSSSEDVEVINCVESVPVYSPTEGIEVISENIRHRGSSFQQSLPQVFIVNQSTGDLEPTSVSTQVICTSSRIASFPCEKDLATNSESNSASIKCPICFDDSQTIQQSDRQLVVTVCGHIYCNVCLENVLKVNRQCSKCRKRLSKKQYHPLYL